MSSISGPFYVQQLLLFTNIEIFLDLNEFSLILGFAIRCIQLLFVAYFYLDEKSMKMQFIERYLLIQRLKDCDFILKETLPNSILIVKQ